MWLAHQRMGFFGFDATGEGAPQMLHRVKVDVDEAMEATKDVRQAWLRAQQHPGCPAFTGGVLDAWPQRMVDGFAVLTVESRMVTMFLRSQKEVAGG